MKYLMTVFLVVFLVGMSHAQEKEGFAGRPITGNLMMPTGNTLNAGEFSVGIGPVEFGISDNVQIGTNLLLFILQIYNADLKVSFINTERQAFSAGLGVAYFNLNVFGEGDVSFTAFSPYVAYTTAVGAKTRMHFSGNYSYFEGDFDIGDADLQSGTAGTSLAVGVEHSISNKTKFLGDIGYDLEFEGVRVGGGVLWGWEVFRLKLGLQYFAPSGSDGFVFPYIGLWWRFDG